MNEMPNHIGVIMDGNGRWATRKGLDRSKGHKAGGDAFINMCTYLFDKGLKFLSVFAFSTENFKRDKKEVDYLMSLFIKFFTTKKSFITDRSIKVVFSGRRDNLSKEVNKAMDNLIDETKENTNGILNICLNYGGQDEIVDMTKKIASKVFNGEIDIKDIDKDLISKNLYNDLPPLDFVIRTSGEMRISNFMLYQSSYAEFYFPTTLFPDFDEKEIDKAIEVYNNRNRTYGNVKK